jgi:hypothetical protein
MPGHGHCFWSGGIAMSSSLQNARSEIYKPNFVRWRKIACFARYDFLLAQSVGFGLTFAWQA